MADDNGSDMLYGAGSSVLYVENSQFSGANSGLSCSSGGTCYAKNVDFSLAAGGAAVSLYNGATAFLVGCTVTGTAGPNDNSAGISMTTNTNIVQNPASSVVVRDCTFTSVTYVISMSGGFGGFVTIWSTLTLSNCGTIYYIRTTTPANIITNGLPATVSTTNCANLYINYSSGSKNAYIDGTVVPYGSCLCSQTVASCA